MNDPQRFPLAVKSGDWNKRDVPDLNQVVAHYSRALNLALSDGERSDLVQFLKSL